MNARDEVTAPDPRLEEIEGRLSKATPGPWEAVFEDGEDWISIAAAPIESGVCPEVATIEIGGERDAEFIASAPADVPHLLAELRKAQDKLARVEGLHRPIKKWEPYEGAGYTFATREEALRAGGEEDLGAVAIEAGPQYFEVCAECGRIESEQLIEIGEEWGYRESLWPCPTAAAVADATGGGE